MDDVGDGRVGGGPEDGIRGSGRRGRALGLPPLPGHGGERDSRPFALN